MAKENRFSPKEVVAGVKASGRQTAIQKQALRKKNLINATLSGLPLIALYDPDLNVVRVFVRTVNGKSTKFSFENGRIVDELTGSLWTAGGLSVEGKMSGKQLKQHPTYDVMWFAWYAFFPETEVLD